MRKILVFVAVAMAAAMVRAELLYFMVNAFSWTGPKNFDYAMVWAADADTGDKASYLMIQGSPESGVAQAPFAAVENEDRYTATGWADFGEYASDDYVFFIETYSNDSNDPISGYSADTAVSYQYLKANRHVYIPGETDPQDMAAWAVPEPTSGMLMLFGAALLALRRRKMKGLLAVAMAAGSMATFGAADDTLITFSTKGPDKYLDGTTVQDGECYALCWTKDGAEFEGIAADGTAVGEGSEVIVFAPIAKGGRCPYTMFELDAEKAESYKGGRFFVCLVDTRLAGGKLGAVADDGLPQAVNGYGKVEVEAGSERGSGVTATAKSALPAGTPKPKVTAIKIVGNNVFLTVKNTLPCLQYAAKEVKLGSDVEGESGSGVQGAGDKEITIIVPKKGDKGLYTVDRK